jgi:hypothetical protein
MTLLFSAGLTLAMSIVGATIIIGVRLMIDQRRRQRDLRSLRRWQVAGVITSAIPLLLVGGVGSAAIAHKRIGGIGTMVLQSHLIWLAIAAVIATATLIFSGDLGNDAKSWLQFRRAKRSYTSTLNAERAVYSSADGVAVRAAMELAQGTRLYKSTYGEPPLLPPLDLDVEQFIRERFTNALPAHRDADQPDDGTT